MPLHLHVIPAHANQRHKCHAGFGHVALDHWQMWSIFAMQGLVLLHQIFGKSGQF